MRMECSHAFPRWLLSQERSRYTHPVSEPTDYPKLGTPYRVPHPRVKKPDPYPKALNLNPNA